ncbi:hypothetical protein UlMin_042167 [Ulmus minor]
MEIKRKTPIQLEVLENLYLEDKYPTQAAMKNHAVALGLTYKQIQGWFVEKRRKEKRENKISTLLHSTPSKKFSIHGGRNLSEVAARMVVKQASSTSIHKQSSKVKMFCKDGPPLGVEFDSIPSRAFFNCKDPGDPYPACKENQSANKRRKVSEKAVASIVCNDINAPVKRHGMGKGLMTVWRATNPHAGDIPTGIDFADVEVTGVSPNSSSVSHGSLVQVRRPLKQNFRTKQERLRSKLQEKKKNLIRRREVVSYEDGNQKLPQNKNCELALEEAVSKETFQQISMLTDDEELELRGLETVPDVPGCSGHFTTNGLRSCSLCKDMLAEFPPNSVKMKQPLSSQPWESSPEIVKKLFKVFHFLYTYSLQVDICPFTLDEFAQAFHDKDSLILGKIHVALLKLLLSDIEVELSSGFLPHLSKSCNFLSLLHSVETKKSSLEFWRRSLNPLTWTEILRQILFAAGFGAKQNASRREALSKEMYLMVKYNLHPGTLKGELFRILLEQGNNGLKVSELAKSCQIVDLNLANTNAELENLICSMLSSDITLFEKISSSTYRLRINSILKKVEDFLSDTEDSGTVDDDLTESGTCSSDEDSWCNAGNSSLTKVKNLNHDKRKSDILKVNTEIDESNSGEVWLLGLMEGEYSDLTIEEKLNSLVALIDLLHEGSSIRMEDPTNAITECIPSIYNSGSGAKIKRSSAKHHSLLVPSWGYFGQIQGVKEGYTYLKHHAIDSSASFSKFYERFSDKGKSGKETEKWEGAHPMQSVFLGCDRRYSRYWLFLGPCNANDPGHRRVYFESSEDGHWEVIDTEEALCALLLVLDDRGKREALLIDSLEKRQSSLCQAMSSRMVNNTGTKNSTQFDPFDLDMVREDSYSPISDVENNLAMTDITCNSMPSSGAVVLQVGNKGEEQKQKWRRLQAFDSWIWNSFYLNLNSVKHGKRSYFDSLTRCECCHDLYWRDEKHCRVCHTTFEIDFDQEERYAVHTATCRNKEVTDVFPKFKVLSSQIQSLKAATYAIESVMPEGALIGAWTKSAHKLWVKRLRRTSSLQELFQVLADFIGAINKDWLCQCDVMQSSYNVGEEIIACFMSLPQTTSAVALWLVKLDALVAPYLERADTG